MIKDLIEERKKKLDEYRLVASPYPATVKRSLSNALFLQRFSTLERTKKKLSLVGRVTAIRDQGGVIFLDVEDGTAKVQFVARDETTERFGLIRDALDTSDFVSGEGVAFRTARGEKSLQASQVRLIAKSLRPIPKKWYGLEDTETRLRDRYLDTFLHHEVRKMFVRKNLFWDEVRAYLKKAGFLEVETPVLESVPGGADARPFVTHHNALNQDFYLRISLELPLKKLLVGGFEKVFEIGRIFRNEGIDREHLQDYTQMECYAAYEDYEDMMEFVERLYKRLIKKVVGSMATKYAGGTLKWGKKRWPRIDYYKVFKEETDIDLSNVTSRELERKATQLKLEVKKGMGKGRFIDLIFNKSVRPTLQEPCFLIDPPVEIEPLAKRLDRDPSRVARFQVLAAGTELGKGFTELNDPLDQRKRFEEQMRLRAAGDEEAQRLDESFLRALEYGMPPAAGFGMSERLFAVLMDKPVRETVIFPLMKPKQ